MVGFNVCRHVDLQNSQAVMAVAPGVAYSSLRTRRLYGVIQCIEACGPPEFAGCDGGGDRHSLQLSQNTPPVVWDSVDLELCT